MLQLQKIIVSNHVPVLISFLVILILLLCLYFINAFKKNQRHVKFAKGLPGPPCLPVIGNGLDFCYGGNDAMDKLMKYSEKYGHLYRLWFGKHLLIGLSKAEDLEDVFMNSKMLGKPELFEPFQDFWGNGSCTAPTRAWKKSRKRIQPIFGNNLMSFYTPQFNHKIYSAINAMQKLVNGPEFDAWDHLPYLSFDIITKTALNVELDSHDKSILQFHECIKTAMQTSFEKMFIPWFHIKWIRNLVYGKQAKEIRNSMINFSKQTVRDKLNEIKRNILRKNSRNQLPDEELSQKTFLTTAYELHEKEAKDETKLHDEIITMIGGGTDTVAIINSFFLLAVAIHQDIQDKLYAEISEVFGESDRYANHYDVERLFYLDQVLKETLRRFTLVPMVFRGLEEDCKIGDRVFPAGVALAISIIGVHLNPDYYPDPLKFNPENFDPEAVKKRHKLSFLPFSAGARNCIGQNYGILEMKLTLVALLRHFSFHSTVKMEDIKMNMGYIMTCSDGYRMSIKPRIKQPSYLS